MADGCLLSGDVGLRVDFVDSTEAELSELAVRPAFESGSRLWKTDIGPLKPNRIVNLMLFVSLFNPFLLYFSNSDLVQSR